MMKCSTCLCTFPSGAFKCILYCGVEVIVRLTFTDQMWHSFTVTSPSSALSSELSILNVSSKTPSVPTYALRSLCGLVSIVTRL